MAMTQACRLGCAGIDGQRKVSLPQGRTVQQVLALRGEVQGKGALSVVQHHRSLVVGAGLHGFLELFRDPTDLKPKDLVLRGEAEINLYGFSN